MSGELTSEACAARGHDFVRYFDANDDIGLRCGWCDFWVNADETGLWNEETGKRHSESEEAEVEPEAGNDHHRS